MEQRWTVLGSELSPFTLKLLLICRVAGLPVQFHPAEARPMEALAAQLRRWRLVNGHLPLTWPARTDLDEYPLVPFLFGPDGENLVDSSAIATWLDREQLKPSNRPLLVPTEDAAAAFVCCLLDEYADEFGLYMVHHNRWKVAATDNDAGTRLASEAGFGFAPVAAAVGTWFSQRQVRRLPYLFSVAPEGFRIPGLPSRLTPPARPGFPATHTLLESAFANLLRCLEDLLNRRPYVLGERFTLADASLYGELGMNLADPSAEAWIRHDAPSVRVWLERLHHPDGAAPDTRGELVLDESLRPLLAEVCRTYVSLQHQNLRAFLSCNERGEQVFNEAAFWQERALYDGRLDGEPFRAVVKTFQVQTWRALRARFDALDSKNRGRIEALLPRDHGLDRDT